jgi:apolipoprotein N-acyltransferase
MPHATAGWRPSRWSCFAGGLALFWAVAGWAAVRLAKAPVARALAFAPLLTLFEAARGTVLTGFPWAFPGHALIDTPWLAVSAFAGAHGLTLLVAGAGALWASCLMVRRLWPAAVAALAVLFLPFGLPFSHAPAAAPDAPVVRLIQPNAPQHLKWQPDLIPVFWQQGRDLTAAAPDPELGAPDLVVWPETSFPYLLADPTPRACSFRSPPEARRCPDRRAAGGAVHGAQHARAGRGGGALAAVYDKHHLVPFGEYLPLQGLADQLGHRGARGGPAGRLQPGFRSRRSTSDRSLGHAFPMICYEAIFPGYIRRRPRPDWMVHVTNDAWFGNFSGPWQHLALARLRAAEQGLPVLRAANTGVSAVIDARGQVLAPSR